MQVQVREGGEDSEKGPGGGGEDQGARGWQRGREGIFLRHLHGLSEVLLNTSEKPDELLIAEAD